jgi:hypothetical protein
MGGEGSARWHLNRGEGKMGTTGSTRARGRGRGGGGRVKASVMHLVARQRGGDGVRWPVRHATGGDERCRADDSRGLNGAADRWV